MEQLHEIFYNPKSGYMGLNDLIKTAKYYQIKLPYDDIANWYWDQPVNQIFKPVPINKNHKKIICPYYSVGCVQADLMDVSRWSRFNNNIKFLLNIVDIYSRYAWSLPLKTKKPSEVADKLKPILTPYREFAFSKRLRASTREAQAACPPKAR